MTGGPKDEGVAIILDATPWNYRPSTGGWAAGCFHNAAGVSWFRNDVTQRRSSFVLGAEGFQQPIERRWFPRQLVGLGSECGGFDSGHRWVLCLCPQQRNAASFSASSCSRRRAAISGKSLASRS